MCFAVINHQRRRRDLNPRAAINDLHPFQGCPFSLLGTSAKKQSLFSLPDSYVPIYIIKTTYSSGFN